MISFSKAQKKHIIQLKVKHIVVRTKKEAVKNIDIKILVLKTPHSRLVHPIDWLVTVLL